MEAAYEKDVRMQENCRASLPYRQLFAGAVDLRTTSRDRRERFNRSLRSRLVVRPRSAYAAEVQATRPRLEALGSRPRAASIRPRNNWISRPEAVVAAGRHWTPMANQLSASASMASMTPSNGCALA